LNSLVNQLLLPLEGSFAIEVRRSHLLTDALKEAKKKKFNPMKTMRVCNPNTIVEGKIKLDLGSKIKKSRETREQLKRESPIPADMLVNIKFLIQFI